MRINPFKLFSNNTCDADALIVCIKQMTLDSSDSTTTIVQDIFEYEGTSEQGESKKNLVIKYYRRLLLLIITQV